MDIQNIIKNLHPLEIKVLLTYTDKDTKKVTVIRHFLGLAERNCFPL